MLIARTRIGRLRRKVTLRAFLCGAVCGAAVATAVIKGGGQVAAALLIPLGLVALAVMIFGIWIGDLRRRAEELADMLGAVHSGLLVLDSARVCVSLTRRLRDLLGMPPDWDPTGLTVTAILAELADRGDFGPRLSRGQPIDPELFRSPVFHEIYGETPEGRVVSFAASELQRGGWVLTCTDITEHKEQTRAILSAKAELEQSEARARQLASDAKAANDAKSAFLAAISHEIRTPMTGIVGMSEILAESELSEEQGGHVATIRQSCQSLLVIINDILDLAKIEAGRMTLECAPFDLRATIEGVLRLVSPEARQRGLAVGLDYDAGLPERFVGDQQRLRQVLINLVGNAAKFTLEGSILVGVRGRLRGDRMALEIAVADTGIGIARADCERIFGEFARVEGETARRFDGTGLGLAISRKLVGMMRGEIGVESEPGVGATFTLRLALPVAEETAALEAPREPAPQAREGAPGRLAPVVPGRKLKVLLVEDNRTNQLVVGGMLASEPVELSVSGNGLEAVQAFRRTAPDVVLMDICMPEMDGFAATAAIRGIEAEAGLSRTPVIALTACAGPEDRARCMAAGMDDHLCKPLDKPALVAAIRTHAAGRGAPVPQLAQAG